MTATPNSVTDESAVTVRGLNKHYGKKTVFKDFNLNIQRGRITAVLGPNGAGKSTLVEILEGLRTRDGGEVRVFGFDPAKEREQLVRRIGVQLQHTPFVDELTCRETLGLYRDFYNGRGDLDTMLGFVGLSDKSKARVDSLSGGQKQKLALAMALIHDPELVFLDEPSTGLDPSARRDIHRLIQALKDRNHTVVLTTHYLEEAEKLCDRVIVLNGGRVVADGTPLELMSRSTGSSTVYFRVDGDLETADLEQAGNRLIGEGDGGYRTETENPTAFIMSLAKALEKQRINLLDLRLHRPTLEDVYLELITEDPAGGAL